MGLAVLARRGVALWAVLVPAVLALFLWAAPARADLELCPPGEGAGECAAPQRIGAQRALATDTEIGRLYVADEANNRINAFEADGDFLFAFGWGVDTGTAALETCTTASGCQAGLAGSGPGQFDRPTGVTVDNDPASPTPHAVYVSELGKDEGSGKGPYPRIQKFDPTSLPVKFVWMIGEGVDKTDGSDLCTKAESHTCGKGEPSSAEGGFASDVLIAAGPAGVLYAVDEVREGDVIGQRLQRFEPSGALIPPEAILFEGTLTFAVAIAVDAVGDLWVADNNGLHKYSPTGTPISGPVDPEANFAGGLAIDAAGDLYAAQRESRAKGFGSFNVIAAYDPTGNILRRFAYTQANGGPFGNSINGLAAHASAFGEIFFSLINEGISYVFEPPPGPVVAPPSLEAVGIGSAKATLTAEVNPEGKETTVHFEYLTEAEWKGQGESFIGPATKETPTESLGATGFNLSAFEDLAGCPVPETEAGDPKKGCLTPETTYRWRVVAANADGEGNSPLEGPPFTTKESPELGEIWATRVGTDTARLNGELNPNGIPATGFFEYVDDATYLADIQKAEEEGKTPEEALEAGFAHATKAPAGAPLDFGAGEEFTTRQVAIYPLAPGTVYHYRLIAANTVVLPVKSDAEELRTFEPPEAESCPANQASRIGPGALLPDCRAYEMVSPLDKDGGDIRVLGTSVGAPAVLEQSSDSGEKLAYGSSRSFDEAASAPYTSQYISRRIAGKEWETHPINPPRGRPVLKGGDQFDTEFKFFSADLCEAWLTTFAEPPLGEGALAELSNLYRRTDEDGLCGEGGKAGYEALAPLGKPSVQGPNFIMVLFDVSADGEHAVFTVNDKLLPEGTGGQRQLYESARGEGLRFVCILPGGGATSGSCTAGSAAGPSDPGTQIGRISSDGGRIFWSSTAGGEGEIYVRIGGAQTVAVSEEGEEKSGTSGSWFWGAARDGSVAIFSTADAEAGISDLYEFDVDDEETHLIAKGVRGVMGISEDAGRVYFASTKVLSGGEANSNGEVAQADKANLYLREAGGSIEFVGTLASADLTQAVLSEPYRNHTARVSPDGAHAAFVSVAPLTGYDNKDAQSGVATEQIFRYDAGENELSCVSCNPSGARPAGRASIPFWLTGMHAARVLSDDGSRLWFESPDVLAARDSNGKVDVYQWEEPGSGGCDEADAGFSAAAGGCVELISSGQSPLDSRFVESSPTGSDVFFATGASLLPQDFGVVDIYDARLGGGLPIPPPLKPPCEGDACHAQIPAPEEPTPASSDYVAPPEGKPAKRRCAKGKHRVIRKGKSRCVPKRAHKRRGAAR